MKKSVIISIILFILGLSINTYDYIDNKKQQISEKASIKVFFEKEKTGIEPINNEIEYNYTSVLEIPKINLKKGMVDKDSIYNNVNENIEILKESTMPDKDDHNFILAAHSGTAGISYFKHLNKLSLEDNIYVYYKNVKYTYKINNIYEEEKGFLTIKNNSNNKNIIVLTTCKPITDDMQYSVVGHLVNKSLY